MAMMTRLLPASPSGPFSPYLKVLPATTMRSIHALSWLGMMKLYIGAPITTISAAKNSSSTAWPAAMSWARAMAGSAPCLAARCGPDERDGLVTRTVFPTIPPRVDYELTELGRGLSKPVEALGKWAFEHQAQIEGARQKFD